MCFLNLCVYGICIDILLGFYCVCSIFYMGIICDICMDINIELFI